MRVILDIYNISDWSPGGGSAGFDEVDPICAEVEIDKKRAKYLLSLIKEVKRLHKKYGTWRMELWDGSPRFIDEEGLHGKTTEEAATEGDVLQVTDDDIGWAAIYKHTEPPAIVETARIPLAMIKKLAAGKKLSKKEQAELWPEREFYAASSDR